MEDTTTVPAASGPRTSWLYRLSGVAAAGLAGWVVDVVVLWVLAEVVGTPAALAAFAGFLAAGLTNFVINRLVFTRPGGRTHRQAVRYGILFAANLVVVTIAVPALGHAVEAISDGIPAPLVVGKILVTAVTVPVNAWLYGAWVFKA